MIQVPVTGDGLFPVRAHEDDAGYDMYAVHSAVIQPGETRLVGCGFRTAIPEGYVGLVCSRSGLALKRSVFVLNAPGVIDSGYRGEWTAILHNAGTSEFLVAAGSRIAQALFFKLADVNLTAVKELPETARGSGGFGSTGA